MICAILVNGFTNGDINSADQVHLSFGDEPSSVVITWSTPFSNASSEVRYLLFIY